MQLGVLQAAGGADGGAGTSLESDHIPPCRAILSNFRFKTLTLSRDDPSVEAMIPSSPCLEVADQYLSYLAPGQKYHEIHLTIPVWRIKTSLSSHILSSLSPSLFSISVSCLPRSSLPEPFSKFSVLDNVLPCAPPRYLLGSSATILYLE